MKSDNLVPGAFLRLGGEKPWEQGWKSENQVVVRSNKPIKLGNPSKHPRYLLHALVKNHCVGEKSCCFVVVVVVLFCFFFFVSFYFIKALQSENNSNVVYVLGCKNGLDLLIAHFNPCLAAWARN